MDLCQPGIAEIKTQACWELGDELIEDWELSGFVLIHGWDIDQWEEDYDKLAETSEGVLKPKIIDLQDEYSSLMANENDRCRLLIFVSGCQSMDNLWLN